MILHESRVDFNEAIIDTAVHFGINDLGIVEKDYFVTLFLKHLARRQHNLIFKGGTCLSKAYKVINRFSEDIDLALFSETEHIGRGKRKRFKEAIVSVATELGFTVINLTDTRSKNDFNQYRINYGAVFTESSIEPLLLVETSVFMKSFPTEELEIASMIYDYLASLNEIEEIENYALKPFKISVQALERTFVDKVFAIVDYHLA